MNSTSLFALLLLAAVALAQDPVDSSASVESSVEEGGDRLVQAPSPPSTEGKRVNFVPIPMLSYNRSFGAMFGAMANLVYDISSSDTVSPPSSAAVWGSYFTNHTFFVGGTGQNYFKEDRWRSSLLVAYGNVEFQTFVDIPPEAVAAAPELPEDTILDYNTSFFVVNAAGLRQVKGNFYLGLQSTLQVTSTTFYGIDDPRASEENTLFGFGLTSEYDDRDNSFNPQSGLNGKFKTMSYLEVFGSTAQYHRLILEYNHYFELRKRMVLLARFNSAVSLGDVPFSGQNVVGRDDLRGYSQGEFRGNQLYDIQTAFRWRFYKRLGLVAFGGVAVTMDDIKGSNFSGVLPAVGAGFRFMVLEKRGMNVGFDIAVGKDDWGLYFRVGEAFSR